MSREAESFTEREKSAAAILAAVFAVRAIAGTHERCAKGGAFVGPRPAMRQAQGVADFMRCGEDGFNIR